MCEVLSVSRSGYYEWKDRPISKREESNIFLLKEIKRIFYSSKSRYGYKKVFKQLQKEGFCCSKNRVAKLMSKNKLIAKVKKSLKLQLTLNIIYQSLIIF